MFYYYNVYRGRHRMKLLKLNHRNDLKIPTIQIQTMKKNHIFCSRFYIPTIIFSIHLFYLILLNVCIQSIKLNCKWKVKERGRFYRLMLTDTCKKTLVTGKCE